MTQKDKDLLLRYLSMALPYGVYLKLYIFDDSSVDCKLTAIDTDGDISVGVPADVAYNIIDAKPYLRPISSITKEEKKEFDNFCVIDEFVWEGKTEIGYKNQAIIMSVAINWLLKKHFDFLDLISKGLAIAITEENNPY